MAARARAAQYGVWILLDFLVWDCLLHCNGIVLGVYDIERYSYIQHCISRCSVPVIRALSWVPPSGALNLAIKLVEIFDCAHAFEGDGWILEDLLFVTVDI